ncbi:hypothetical protein KI385_03930 [Streptomyces inhibens]|nr:hypothetical protein [Streptomyces inhibens]UKY48041.1 hypothetical protein KI385_03930 [Streptomyces inhibens]
MRSGLLTTCPKKLLATATAAAAVVMSAFLIVTSFVTTLLIPEDAFKPGGEANGHALAHLTHAYLGSAFSAVHDIRR